MNMEHLPYPPIGKGAKSHVLTDDLQVEQWIIPAGTTIKLYQSENFGIVSILPETKDKRGFVIPRKLFKY